MCFAPFCKGVYSKRKEFASIGRKFFPFLEGLSVQGNKQEVTNAASIMKKKKKKKKKRKRRKIYQVYQVPLNPSQDIPKY